MLKLILLSSTTLLVTGQDTLFPVHGSDGVMKFSVNNDGSANLLGEFSSDKVTASTSLTSPSITAGTTLKVGETDVAGTFDANAADRAAMQQAIDKLEADSAAGQIAEQEQNARVEKIEADAATNAASDAELAERVAKAEAEAQMAAKAEEEQKTMLEEKEKAWAEKTAAMETAFNEKYEALEAKYKKEHDAQQKVLDQLVKIMSRFDVSGELESLRQANQGQPAATPPQ
jgi:flagellar biosynthesis GTPase FlhF